MKVFLSVEGSQTTKYFFPRVGSKVEQMSECRGSTAITRAIKEDGTAESDGASFSCSAC